MEKQHHHWQVDLHQDDDQDDLHQDEDQNEDHPGEEQHSALMQWWLFLVLHHGEEIAFVSDNTCAQPPNFVLSQKDTAAFSEPRQES